MVLTQEDRLITIESTLADMERMMDELNEEIIRQAKVIDHLTAQNKMLIEALKESNIKPQSEETPPPHY